MKIGLLLAVPQLLGIISCSTISVPSFSPKNVALIRQRLINGAYALQGKKSIVVRGRRFNADCSGTVFAIYYGAGIDLTSQISDYRGGGVERLYRMLEDHLLLHRNPFPQPGDLVFWDNTFDKNGDGFQNDPLTHIGMVVRSSFNGSIEYVHYHSRRGVVVERMNLFRPNVYTFENGKGAVVNSPMRSKQGGMWGNRWLSGQLFRAFGAAYRL